ncbi:MAG: 23S rRNA (guanosine(2251)-2'-O)-methyltransferase RlmB [Endomicrobium sp.]|jgi:23S rRNA (guanosine2251-2'-O)-methyltransferase|nr:23S rRNA (guanosine(2251)-2'-O)-methyltransferase RlmB [Endomicrobium sp.]
MRDLKIWHAKFNKNNNSSLTKNIVYGRNPVLELLKANKRSVNKIMLSQTARGTTILEIINLAKHKSIAVHNVPPKKLDSFSRDSQGVVAEVSSVKYADLGDLIKKSKESPRPLLVVLDGIEDPHNLGAIIRNCVAFGADGIIIPKWRAVGINESVAKSSAGSVEHISISRVANINQTLNLLKKNGFWIAVGVKSDGRILGKIDLCFPMALIMGSEGFGVRNLIKKNCDFLISIPQKNTISSLNVSCASAIILYEVSKGFI